jgi:hypothetical protein
MTGLFQVNLRARTACSGTVHRVYRFTAGIGVPPHQPWCPNEPKPPNIQRHRKRISTNERPLVG